MDALNDVLPVILYAVLIILIVVLIIFVIKALSTVKKINSTIDNVNNKIAKLDKAVSIVDGAADYISIVSDKVVGIISTLITSVFKRKKRKKKVDSLAANIILQTYLDTMKGRNNNV